MTQLTPEQANELLSVIFGKKTSIVSYDVQNESYTQDLKTCGVKEKSADQVKVTPKTGINTELNEAYDELNDTQEELAELQQDFEDLNSSMVTDEDYLDLEYEKLELDAAIVDADIKKFALEFVQDINKSTEINIAEAQKIVDFFREY